MISLTMIQMYDDVMGLNNIDLNNINLDDDDFDNDPEGTIYVRLMA